MEVKILIAGDSPTLDVSAFLEDLEKLTSQYRHIVSDVEVRR